MGYVKAKKKKKKKKRTRGDRVKLQKFEFTTSFPQKRKIVNQCYLRIKTSSGIQLLSMMSAKGVEEKHFQDISS